MSLQQEEFTFHESSIPAHLVIGVTGHRELSNETSVAEQVRLALEKVSQMIPCLTKTDLVFTVLSSLAEGADRLVAIEVLKTEGAELKAVLPVTKEDYMRGFKSPESRAEFNCILGQARETPTVCGNILA